MQVQNNALRLLKRWHYRDSYAGYAQSWGQEVIWYKNKPLWTQIYGGGMEDLENVIDEFCEATFKFLKQVLSLKHSDFQPRGSINPLGF